MIITLTQWVKRYWCIHGKRKSAVARPHFLEHLEPRQLLTTATSLQQSLMEAVGSPIDPRSVADTQTAGHSDHDEHSEDGPHALPLPGDWKAADHDLPRDSGALHSLASIPVLNSNPSAAVNIYLDFDGNFQNRWGGLTNLVTPAFTLDRDDSTFSDYELDAIREIFARVAEDYAPFNVNVTTLAPAVIGDGNGVRVAIGGRYQDWYGAPAGGVAFIDNFTSSQENIVFVFGETLADPKSIAEAATHEAGHAFGLSHQSEYDASGKKIAEYYDGNSSGAPIMGVSYKSPRSRWWQGPSTSATAIQDDLAQISRPENGFGYRQDDHGDVYDLATNITLTGSRSSIAGIISQMNDVDVIRFEIHDTDQYRIDYHAAQVGANLDARVQILRLDGTLLFDQTTVGENSLSYGSEFSPGSYQIIVQSNGVYGSLGQYTLQASMGSDSSLPPTAPTDFAAYYVSPTAANFNWNDAFGEDHYVLYASRTVDGKRENYAITIPENATSYSLVDHGELKGWQFRLQAVNRIDVTSSRSITPVDIPLTAPENVRAATFTSDSLAVFWNSVPGAAGYVVRIASADSPDRPVKTTVVDGTRTESIVSGLQSGVEYSITVTARNSLGETSGSPILAEVASTPDAPFTTAANITTRVAPQRFRVKLAWQKVQAATLYQVQQRQGKDWITVEVVPSTMNSVELFPDGNQVKAQFRVVASNGHSTITSKVAKVRIPVAAWLQRGASKSV